MPVAQEGLQVPKVDIEDHEHSYVLKADLPGVKKERRESHPTRAQQ